MTAEGIAHVIGAVATVLWVGLAAYALWILRQPITAAVGRLGGVEAFGIKFALSGGAALNAAIELAEKNPQWPVEVPAGDREAAFAQSGRRAPPPFRYYPPRHQPRPAKSRPARRPRDAAAPARRRISSTRHLLHRPPRTRRGRAG